jgi:hypothetical protein
MKVKVIPKSILAFTQSKPANNNKSRIHIDSNQEKE